MSLFQLPIQNKLSALLGVQVTFEKLNVSLLGGMIEALGMSVAGRDAAEPLLNVRRIKAEISIPRALKREIAIKSLAIERPVLSIVRHANGGTNLPERVEGLEKSALAQTPSDTAPEPTTGEAWDFLAQRVLLVDGEIHYRKFDPHGEPHSLSLSPITAELVQRENAFDLTLMADHLAQRDGSDLGPLKLSGRFSGISSLRELRSAGLEGEFNLGERLHGQVRSTAIATETLRFLLDGTIDLAQILSLLRPLLPTSAVPIASGEVSVAVDGAFKPRQGLQIGALNIQGIDLAVPFER